MAKILKNATVSPITVNSVTIAASPGSYTIPPQDYLVWAANDGVITYIGAGSLVVNDGSVDLGVAAGTSLIQGLYPTTIIPQGLKHVGFYPDPSNHSTGTTQDFNLDTSGALQTRSTVLTDEDSFRDDFLGTSLTTTLAGTATFVNGSLAVVGIGTTFLSQVNKGDYIKLTADAETAFAIVASVDSNLSITLAGAYTGTGGTGVTVRSSWATVTGAGSTITVAADNLTIAMPVTTGIISGVFRHGDYGPMKWVNVFSVSARRANQTIQAGMGDSFATPSIAAYFEFTGTVATSVNCVSGPSAASLQTTTILIPGGLDTSTARRYEVNVSDDTVEFLVDGLVLAQHRNHIPYSYQVMEYGIRVVNTGTVAGVTSVVSDLTHFKNFDQLEMSTSASGKPVIVTLATPVAATGVITTTQSVPVLIDGNTSVGIEITGTWTGTVVFESLVGATWSLTDAFNVATELTSSSTTVSGVFTLVNVAGITQVRVRGLTVATGSAVVMIVSNNGNFTYPLFARSQGSTIGSYGVQLGGVDESTSTFQFQKVNTLGAAGIYIEGSNKPTYSVSGPPITPPAATPTDIVTLYGSATKVVRILRIVLNSTQTTLGINDWFIIKRSTVNTGGASTAVTPVPHDSNFPASTATNLRYTANPTALGTLVGNAAIVNIVSPPSAPGTSGTAYVPYVFDFTNDPIVLRGVAQGVAINFNGAALPAGLSVNYHIVYRETTI
jgi:hypothetical protein